MKRVYLENTATSQLCYPQKHDFTPAAVGCWHNKEFQSEVQREAQALSVNANSDDQNAYETAKEIDVIQALKWITSAWKEVSKDTINNCFAKCDVVEKPASTDNNEDVDEEVRVRIRR